MEIERTTRGAVSDGVRHRDQAWQQHTVARQLDPAWQRHTAEHNLDPAWQKLAVARL